MDLADKRNLSVPSFPQRNSLFSAASREHLLARRRSTTDAFFTNMNASPLHDLAPVALPGLATRVTRNSSVGISLDSLGDAFQLDPSADTVVTIEGGYTSALMWASGVAVLSSMQYGYNLGNMNTAADAMRTSLGIPVGSLDDDNIWGLCVSIFCLGALVGCSVSASFSDRLGRKAVLLGTSFVFTLGAVLEAAGALPGCPGGSCPLGAGVILMLVGRVITGVACGATTVVVPMYLGEIAPPHLRGTLGTCFQLCCCVAMLIAQVLGLPALMGSARLWPLYVLLVLVPAGAQLLFRDKLLESPRWLAGRSHEEAFEAQHVLAALRGQNNDDVAVLKELDFMQMGQVNKELEIPGCANASTSSTSSSSPPTTTTTNPNPTPPAAAVAPAPAARLPSAPLPPAPPSASRAIASLRLRRQVQRRRPDGDAARPLDARGAAHLRHVHGGAAVLGHQQRLQLLDRLPLGQRHRRRHHHHHRHPHERGQRARRRRPPNPVLRRQRPPFAPPRSMRDAPLSCGRWPSRCSRST